MTVITDSGKTISTGKHGQRDHTAVLPWAGTSMVMSHYSNCAITSTSENFPPTSYWSEDAKNPPADGIFGKESGRNIPDLTVPPGLGKPQGSNEHQHGGPRSAFMKNCAEKADAGSPAAE